MKAKIMHANGYVTYIVSNGIVVNVMNPFLYDGLWKREYNGRTYFIYEDVRRTLGYKERINIYPKSASNYPDEYVVIDCIKHISEGMAYLVGDEYVLRHVSKTFAGVGPVPMFEYKKLCNETYVKICEEHYEKRGFYVPKKKGARHD